MQYASIVAQIYDDAGGGGCESDDADSPDR